jgi:hypothetical protein
MDADLAPQPQPTATALPARFYVAPSMAAIDRRAIFDRGWQLVAHVSQLRDAGDHVVANLAGLPGIAVRGAASRRRRPRCASSPARSTASPATGRSTSITTSTAATT